MKKIINGILVLLTFFPLICVSEEIESANNKHKPQGQIDVKLPHIGNFAVQDTQQIGPLISYGQTNLDKNQTQLYIFSMANKGVQINNIEIYPSIAYGITDKLTLLLTVPYAASFRQGAQKSSGVEDTQAQLEYAYYYKSSSTFQDQATVFAFVQTPTGSVSKKPPTGSGSPSYYFGSTFSRFYVDWYAFTSPGILVTTPHDNVKSGNQFYYQFGLGKNINYETNKWIFDWLLEANGQYNQKNRINGIFDLNSGGNIVFLTPSLFVSTNNLTLQFGIGFPILQNLYGNQLKSAYIMAGNFAWTF